MKLCCDLDARMTFLGSVAIFITSHIMFFSFWNLSTNQRNNIPVYNSSISEIELIDDTSIPYTPYFIVSVAMGTPYGIASNLSILNHQCYAQKHDYQYRLLTENNIYDIQNYNEFRYAFKNKISTLLKPLLIYDMFTNPKYKNKWDYLLYIDHDSIVKNYHFDLEQIIHSSLKINNKTSFIFARRGAILSAGVLIFKNDEFVLNNIIKLWYRITLHLSSFHVNDSNRIVMEFHDQSALNYILRGYNWTYYKQHILYSNASVTEKNDLLKNAYSQHCIIQHRISKSAAGQSQLFEHCIDKKFHQIIRIYPHKILNCQNSNHDACKGFLQHFSGMANEKKRHHIIQNMRLMGKNKHCDDIIHILDDSTKSTSINYKENEAQIGEIAKAFDLIYVHIAKTGGTLIEDILSTKYGILIANKYNGKYGIFNNNLESTKYMQLYDNCSNVAMHHIPPPSSLQYNISLISKYYASTNEWFTVVRNPFDRYLSEYKYCSGRMNCKKEMINFIKDSSNNDDNGLSVANNLCNVHTFNVYTNYLLNYFLKYKNNTKKLSIFKCHYLPQYYYIYHQNSDEKLTDSYLILKHENIAKEFYNLLSQYNDTNRISNQILTKKHNHANSCSNLNKLQLNDENTRLLRQFYEKDFRYFGYQLN